MNRDQLGAYLDNLLEVTRFRDYCPNGLQVEGRPEIRRIVCGVTASQALIEAAIDCDADAILVHHGWFWKSEDGRVTGFRKQRMARLLAHDINLFAYHLPLDAHAELGNNAQLALRLGWQVEARFGEQALACLGRLPKPLPVADLARLVEQKLGRGVQILGDDKRMVSKLAWCSGAAQDFFEAAVSVGADCYLSGEVSEQNYHLAEETGVPFLACGHHASEQFGVQALASHLQGFGLDCRYVDLGNPI